MILFSLLSLFIGFILFSLFFRSTPPATPSNQPSTYNGNFPTADNGQGQIATTDKNGQLPTTKQPAELPMDKNSSTQNGLSKTTDLTTTPGTNFTLSQDKQKIQFYNKKDGKFYKIDKNGQKTALSNKTFYNVKNVAWANNKDKAIIEYPDGANIIYDFTKEKQITLPKHWEDFAFAPDDKQIVAKSIGLDPQNRFLTIANTNGSAAKYIEPLGNNADSVYSSWSPNNQSIAMFTEGIDIDRQNLYFIGKNKENFKSTIIEGRGFDSKWSPDGVHLLYSVYSNKNQLKPSLWIVNAQGDNIGVGRKNLGLETWVSKCHFTNSQIIYCAVPQILPKGAGLFPQSANTTNDLIYQVNIVTGGKKLISIPDKSFTIDNIIVSADQKTLFFTDKKTKTVHKIDL